MVTGNPGILRPYDQGVEDATKGRRWEQIYNRPGEERKAKEYRSGYFDTVDKMYKKLLDDNRGKE